MKTNYHTHYQLCKHAQGSMEEYVQQAIVGNYDVLGFSDHVPDFLGIHSNRMSADELEIYYEDYNEIWGKYNDQIELHLGFEAEYTDYQLPYYDKILAQNKVEYLILGQHYIKCGNKYISAFEIEDAQILIQHAYDQRAAIESQLFTYVAHPDVGLLSYEKFDDSAKKAADIILSAAEKYQIPLEYNCNGMRRPKKKLKSRGSYPNYNFWQMASQYKIDVIIGNDAHTPGALNDGMYERAVEECAKLRLNRIDKIKFI